MFSIVVQFRVEGLYNSALFKKVPFDPPVINTGPFSNMVAV
jgi:hypothetical protein